jgi:hypothetical protein
MMSELIKTIKWIFSYDGEDVPLQITVTAVTLTRPSNTIYTYELAAQGKHVMCWEWSKLPSDIALKEKGETEFMRAIYV